MGATLHRYATAWS